MTPTPLGDAAVVLTLGDRVDDVTLARAQALAAAIRQHRLPGVVDVVPAFATVTVFYEIARTQGYALLRDELARIAEAADSAVVGVAPRLVEVPVVYGGEHGPDLPAVADYAGVSTSDVVALHSSVEYRVHAIGFSPGFAYLGGLPGQIHAPRKATPRPRVPVGSVGIGGDQTGVYPLGTPGGWNLIGRTPLPLFTPDRPEPSLLRAGDRVRFRALHGADAREAAEQLADLVPEPPAIPSVAPSRRLVAAVDVRRAGMLTTVQDTGRSSYRSDGVPLGGAADPWALRLANLLVGNREDAAALEFTLVGPDLHFTVDSLVATAGGDFRNLPRWTPVRVAAGTTLSLGAAREGCRGYLAVAGGFQVPAVLGSFGTYLRAALGGWEGRALRDGDVLPIKESTRSFDGHWWIDPRIIPEYSSTPTVRVLPGAQAREFESTFLDGQFRVSTQSDRMGIRLEGCPLVRATQRELRSAATVPGTVQVPPDGQPIVLLADAQTIGGYPQIAHVIGVDLPLLAQLRPGDAVRFREVSLDEAHQLALAREHALGMLREGLAQKFA